MKSLIVALLTFPLYTAAFAFIAGTPKVTTNNEGRTYNITGQFSAGNDGSFDCTLRKRASGAMVMRQPCDSLQTDFTGVQRGQYIVKVIRLSENIREVISARVNVPSLTS